MGGFILILLVLIALAVFWYFSTYNSLIRNKNSIDEAFSTMDVYLLKRYDLIPNLVTVVKGYANHEAETLEKIVNARNNAVTRGDKLAQSSELSGEIKNVFALAEAYPDLKANESFLKLQDDLNGLEDDIANARKFYNAVVKRYNNQIETFPSSLVASNKGFLKEPLFEVAYEQQRENVKIDL